MIDVVALGELLIDFLCKDTDAKGYPTLAANPGGAPANFLAALQAYGASTAMLGKVGEDHFGHLLIRSLRSRNIDTRGIISDSSVFTTLAFVTLDENGNRTFSFARKPGADTQLRPEEVDYALIDQAKVFHFGSLSLTDDPSRTATHQAVAYAKQHKKWISVDPNLRKPLWHNLNTAREQIEWALSQADIIKISDDEIDFLWGLSPEAGVKRLLSEYDASLVYATCGAGGCYAANQAGGIWISPPQNISAVDTTGAGDIFGGSAMSRLLALGKHPQELTLQELSLIAGFACCAASLSTQAHGGIESIVPWETVNAYITDCI